jgi:CBS domain-containing protein
MKTKTIKDIMTPLDEYGTISIEATLTEAGQALEEVQKEYEQNRKRHRILLILDANGKIVGKLSQLDVLRALEPKGAHVEDSTSFSRFGVSSEYLKPMFDLCGFWGKPLIDVCKEAGNLKVERLILSTSKDETVDENASLPEAIHALGLEHHQSMLVTRDNKIVGVLRQTDLFKEVVETLSVCQLY